NRSSLNGISLFALSVEGHEIQRDQSRWAVRIDRRTNKRVDPTAVVRRTESDR
ncbi:hypothetical protein ACLOJK_009351, partial [Asimina triloba]